MQLLFPYPMRRLLLLSLGLTLLTACGGPNPFEIRNSNNKVIGSVKMEGTTAIILNSRDEVRGKVRGTVIRDESGKNVGNIVKENGNVVISDDADNALGSLGPNGECYGKGKEILGTVSADVDTSAAAAACLLFFLQ